MMQTEELCGSELGTKEYWQKAYAAEVRNFLHHKDVGEVWFGEESIDRVIRYLEDCPFGKDSSVLDIGCGNGLFLVEMACEGYTRLTGVDYSEDAVKLARLVAADKKVQVNYQVTDICAPDGLMLSVSTAASAECPRQFDICHDKGTYDAVSLSPHEPSRLRQRYIENVHGVLSHAGRLIISSCNWTGAELASQLAGWFRHEHTVDTPQLSYAGVTGTVVSCVVFSKCARQ